MNGEDSTAAVRLRIEGRVQGVWFRGWTVDQAQARGLRGWVRNRGDGSVEALLIGAPDKVRDMAAACHEGPPAASVSAVHEREDADDGSRGFRQLKTE